MKIYKNIINILSYLLIRELFLQSCNPEWNRGQ